MHDYLKALIANKEKEVATLYQKGHLKKVRPRASNKSFKESLQAGHAIIAEVKRQSPSKGLLKDDIDPVLLAQCYDMGGAAAVSVLTDSFGFGGSIKDLENVAIVLSPSSVTTLRKDFIIDPIQIVEAISVGADAILLIISALKEKTAELLKFSQDFNIDALVEVASLEELDYALSLSPELIVVNNRDLSTFEIDTSRALRLAPSIPNDIISVAASGIDSPAAVSKYFSSGYHAVLIGEALVKSETPTQFIKDCLAQINNIL